MKLPRARSPSSAEARESEQSLLAADLEIVSQLEGRRLPTVQALAEELGMSQATAFRTIARIRKSGMVKLVDLVRLPDNVCHSIVNLRTHLTNARDLERLEARLKSDPYVVVAATVTGKHNYRITLVHRTPVDAHAWFRAITTEPAVIDGALTLCRPIIDRHQYAQALSAHQPSQAG